MTTTFYSFRIPKQLFILLFFVLSGLAIVETVTAQASLNQNNISSVRSADITDEQLQTFVRRAQAQGISIDQAIQLAVTRGLPAAEAQELRKRIAALQDESAIYEAKDLGRLEQQIEDDTTTVTIDTLSIKPKVVSNVFGAELFAKVGINFTPSLNIPTPVNYQLGAGDQLNVTIWGDRTDQLSLTVSTEGTIDLQNRGPVYVNGLTIEAASDRIMDQLVQLYSGLKPTSGQPTTFAEISLGRVRTINVTVTGEVQTPGSYSLNALSTVFNALYNSGGPNEIGSFRQIRVVRNNEIVTTFDLYDFLIDGDQSQNIRLRDQDVIQVMPYVNRVTLDGMVLRPAIYELKNTDTVQDLINIAGGFTSNAYTRQIQIYRKTDTQQRIVTVPNNLYGDVVLLNGDSIQIPEILDRFENRVRISGAVWRSGEYELTEGLTLSQLIQSADGLRPDAFMTRGLISRVKPDLSFEQISFNLNDVMNDPNQYDIELKREDNIIIRGERDLRDESVVEIDGSVRNAGVYVWLENMTLEDLILKSDGFRDSADLTRIEISRRANDTYLSGKLVESIVLGIDSLLTNESEVLKYQLQPYDYVFIHRRPDFQIQQFVTLEGEVMYPGKYAITKRNERLSEIIARAGGLTQDAYVAGSRINRQKSSIDRAQIDYNFLGQNENIDSTSTVHADSLNEINKSMTRIGIDLEAALRNPNSRENLYLREGDVIRIPKLAQTVRVTGAVMQEVEVRYVPGAPHSYYLNRAGGFSSGALKKRSYVVYANGDVDRNRRFMWITVDRPDIEPGAEIVIPYKDTSGRLSTQEIVSLSSVFVSMSATIMIAIDRLSR